MTITKFQQLKNRCQKTDNLSLMKTEMDVITVKYGTVEYYDLCVHETQTREEFFGDADLKILRYSGLVARIKDTVKIMFCEDVTDNSECEGIVIPVSCVIRILWRETAVEERIAPELSLDENIN